MECNLKIEDLQNGRTYIANDYCKYSKINNQLYIHTQSTKGEVLISIEGYPELYTEDNLQKLMFEDVTNINH